MAYKSKCESVTKQGNFNTFAARTSEAANEVAPMKVIKMSKHIYLAPYEALLLQRIMSLTGNIVVVQQDKRNLKLYEFSNIVLNGCYHREQLNRVFDRDYHYLKWLLS